MNSENQTPMPLEEDAPEAVDDGVELHPGLPWVADPFGTQRVVAPSPSHPCSWVIDLTEGDYVLWRAFPAEEVFDLDETPAEKMGRFDTAEIAQSAALELDFAIFRRVAASRGLRAELRDSDAFEHAAFGGLSAPFNQVASFMDGDLKSLKKNQNGSWNLEFTIETDLPRWLIDTKLGIGVTLGLVKRDGGEDAAGAAARKRIEEIILRATIRPQDPAFQEWLSKKYDRWFLIRRAMVKDSIAVEEATAETVRRLCGVPSRADFKYNIASAAIFSALDREFYADLSNQRKYHSPSMD